MRPTSYEEYEQNAMQLAKMRGLHEEMQKYATLVQNATDMYPDKYGDHVVQLTRDFAARVEKQWGYKEDVTDKGILKSFGNFWAGVVSNNFQDRQREIIKADAHRDFVAAFNNGNWPAPELWFNHIPFAYGITKGLYFDDNTGMLVAHGIIREDDSRIQKAFDAIMSTLVLPGMSHCAAKGNVMREDNETVSYYRSHELTFMETMNVANMLTSFKRGN